MDRWRVRNRNVHFSPIGNVNYILSTPLVEDQGAWYLSWTGQLVLDLELLLLLLLCLDPYFGLHVLVRGWILPGLLQLLVVGRRLLAGFHPGL